MAPTLSGFFRSKLEITDTAPDSRQSVELEGTATAAPAIGQPIALQPARLKRACPRGKRKVFRKGRRVCIKQRRRRHHRGNELLRRELWR